MTRPLPRLLAGLAALVLARPASAACPTPASEGDIEAAMGTAEDAFSRMDEAAFVADADGVFALLACADEILSRPDIARLHRMEGLRHFLAHDRDRAGVAFSAARATDPKALLPDAIAPPGHALRDLYTAVPIDPATVDVGQPPAGYLLFDGHRGLDRPVHRPTLLQGVAPDGSLWTSAYLQPEDPMPSWPATLVPAVSDHPHTRRNAAVILGSFAIASAASSVALYGVSHSAADRYWDLSTPTGDLEKLRERTNTFQDLAFGVGGIALAGGAAATWLAVGAGP